MIRGFASAVISWVIARFMNVNMTWSSPHEYWLENIRNFLILIQCLVYAWSQFYLPLPVAITLQATAPIFTTIADRIINGVNNKSDMYKLIEEGLLHELLSCLRDQVCPKLVLEAISYLLQQTKETKHAMNLY